MRSKCICIKNYYLRSTVNEPHFEKGKIYEFTDKHYVTREYPDGYNVQVSKGEYLFFIKYKDPLAEKGYSMFSTYFKSLKEIRKEKIKKLNEIRRSN